MDSDELHKEICDIVCAYNGDIQNYFTGRPSEEIIEEVRERKAFVAENLPEDFDPNRMKINAIVRKALGGLATIALGTGLGAGIAVHEDSTYTGIQTMAALGGFFGMMVQVKTMHFLTDYLSIINELADYR